MSKAMTLRIDNISAIYYLHVSSLDKIEVNNSINFIVGYSEEQKHATHMPITHIPYNKFTGIALGYPRSHCICIAFVCLMGGERGCLLTNIIIFSMDFAMHNNKKKTFRYDATNKTTEFKYSLITIRSI